MDDAREKVDSLGEEATQNESLGAALEQAYAARFAQGASSAPTGAEQPQQSSAEPKEHPEGQHEAPQDMSKHGGFAPTEVAAEQEVPKQAAEAPQPDLASLDQSAKASEAAEAAAVNLTVGQPEPSTDFEPVQKPSTLDRSAEAGDAQEGGAAAAAAVHAVPGEAAAAAAPDCEAAVAASVAETAPAATPADPLPDAALAPEAGGAASAAADSGAAETSTAAAEGSQQDASGAQAKHEEPERELPKSLDELSQRILDWHWSHLEYGCCAPLHEVVS